MGCPRAPRAPTTDSCATTRGADARASTPPGGPSCSSTGLFKATGLARTPPPRAVRYRARRSGAPARRPASRATMAAAAFRVARRKNAKTASGKKCFCPVRRPPAPSELRSPSAEALRASAVDRRYDLTLITDADVPWVPDSVRYLKEGGPAFFARCEDAVRRAGRKYVPIRGTWAERTASAIVAVKDVLRPGEW